MTPKQMGRLGLFHIEEAILEVLEQEPHGLKPDKISTTLGIPDLIVQEVLTKLQREGYIESPVAGWKIISSDDTHIDNNDNHIWTAEKFKVFYSGDAVNLSCIKSMDVSDTDDNVKIIIHYQTNRGMSTKGITFRNRLTFDPHREMTQELAQELIEEIETLRQQTDLPIEEVIKLKVWGFGYLSVDLNKATEDQQTCALARLCWNWKFGRNNAPSDEQLEKRTGLDTGTIKCIARTDAYKQCVKDFMQNGCLFEPRTAEEFRAWVKNYRNMPTKFGKHMRLSENDVQELVSSVRNYHGI